MAGDKGKGKGNHSSPPAVPKGWKAIWSDEYNTWYYENIYTRDCVWEKPTEAAYPIQDVGSIIDDRRAVDETAKQLTSRENIFRTEDPQVTNGWYRVPSGVCALLVNKSSTVDANIRSISGGKSSHLAGPGEEGWTVIVVDPGDTLIGYVELYEYKYR